MDAVTQGDDLYTMEDEVASEAVSWIRAASKDVTGGNCAFVDDDLRVLQHLAQRAVNAGLTDGLSSSVRQSIELATTNKETQ